MGILWFAEHSSPVWKPGREMQDDWVSVKPPSLKYTMLGCKLEASRESTEVTKAL